MTDWRAKRDMRGVLRAVLTGTLMSAWGCALDTVIPVAEMPVSENGVYTDDGRFFVVGDSVLYEVTGGPDTFEAEVLLVADCYLGGLTDHGNELYATCVDLDGVEPSELLRIDPSDPSAPIVERAPFPPGAGPQLLNGMDFGPDDALYISNSGSFFYGDPAIYRVWITGDAPFTVDVETFISASELSILPDQGGGLAPNGIRFHGDTMYFVRGLSIARTRLRADGGHGLIRDIYTTPLTGAIDDFDIYADHLIIAEINDLSFLDPVLFQSAIVATDLNGLVKGRKDVPFIPSSTAVREDTLFGERTVIVTSYFNGGLYRLQPLQ